MTETPPVVDFVPDPEADYSVARESNPHFDLTGSFALTEEQKIAEVEEDILPVGPDPDLEPHPEPES